MRHFPQSAGIGVALREHRQRPFAVVDITRWPAGPRTYVSRVVALPLTIQHCQSGFGTSEARFFLRCTSGAQADSIDCADWQAFEAW